MTNPTLGVVADIIAAAPAAAQIIRPGLGAVVRPGTRRDAVVITERAARAVLARRGAGGGLRAQRISSGWLFAPYPGSSQHQSQSALWLVTHDGEATDLAAEPPTA